MDLDYFKKVNDNFGHSAGDEVLKKIGSLLKENIRDVDSCGRWGGEEFLIVCPETNLNDSINLARRLKNIIFHTSFLQEMTLTGSFGVASYNSGDDIKEIIKKADDSLYRAKENGRNRVEVLEKAR